MWRPPNSRRLPLPPTSPPTAEEATHALWFQPLKLGPVDLAQRTWVPAMVPWRATEEGYVSEEVVGWYERFAAGEPGAIVVEATGVRDIPSGPLLRIGHDRFVPGLTKLVEAVRRASGGKTRLFIQIIDFLSVRRRPTRERYFGRFLRVRAAHREALGLVGASEDAVRERLSRASDDELAFILDPRELEDLRRGVRERVTDLHLPHIRDLPRVLPGVFAAAAARAEAAGFDGVELHYAHAYTMASFLSALNDRDDGYGGSREGRVRLPLETYRAVRDAVSSRFAVGCRMLTEECIEDGSTLEDTAYFARAFAEAGMDFISLSRGGKFEDAKEPKVGEAVYPYTGPSGYQCMPTVYAAEDSPFGRNVMAAAELRAALRRAGHTTPTVVAGGIVSFEQAERILADGSADVVASARQTLADPDWFLKLRLGRGAEVRRCELTNYCEGLDQKHKQVTCKLWDRLTLDAPDVPWSHDGRRRLLAPRWKR